MKIKKTVLGFFIIFSSISVTMQDLQDDPHSLQGEPEELLMNRHRDSYVEDGTEAWETTCGDYLRAFFVGCLYVCCGILPARPWSLCRNYRGRTHQD